MKLSCHGTFNSLHFTSSHQLQIQLTFLTYLQLQLPMWYKKTFQTLQRLNMLTYWGIKPEHNINIMKSRKKDTRAWISITIYMSNCSSHKWKVRLCRKAEERRWEERKYEDRREGKSRGNQIGDTEEKEEEKTREELLTISKIWNLSKCNAL